MFLFFTAVTENQEFNVFLLSKLLGSSYDHIYPLGHANIASIDNVEAFAIKFQLREKFVLRPFHRMDRIRINPVKDNLNLIILDAFGNNVLLHIFGDRDDDIRIMIGEFFDPSANFHDF